MDVGFSKRNTWKRTRENKRIVIPFLPISPNGSTFWTKLHLRYQGSPPLSLTRGEPTPTGGLLLQNVPLSSSSHSKLRPRFTIVYLYIMNASLLSPWIPPLLTFCYCFFLTTLSSAYLVYLILRAVSSGITIPSQQPCLGRLWLGRAPSPPIHTTIYRSSSGFQSSHPWRNARLLAFLRRDGFTVNRRWVGSGHLKWISIAPTLLPCVHTMF